MNSKSEIQNSNFQTWCDRIVIGGISVLILFTPLAFGSVHPWAYATMEAVIFLLVAVWMVKLSMLRKGQRAGSIRHFEIRNSKFEIFSLALSLGLFLLFVLFQLVPLPPSFLKVFSPHTFEFYSQTLPGWPEQVPYADVGGQGAEVGGQRSEVRNFEIRNAKSEISPVPAPGFLLRSPCSLPFALCSLLPETWLPLSLAPALTRTDLLKFTAYAVLFFLVLLFPLGSSQSVIRNAKLCDSPSAVSDSNADERFFCALLFAVLFSGLMVAAIGFVHRFSWNGKILWFFTPYDWVYPVHDGVPRASGPYVNADHFANYLALIFPVALGCALFRKSIANKSSDIAVLIFCTLSAFLLFTGILLSLSRIGWISALIGLVVLLWLAPRRWIAGGREVEAGGMEHGARSGSHHFEIRNSKSEIFRLERGAQPFFTWHWSISLSAVCVLLIGSLLFAGADGRQQLDMRLAETVNRDIGIWGRTSIWKDSLGIIRDFPLSGVGLGAWPELFPRYRRAPWTADFYREAHNDYLELLAETGAIGFGLLGWFFFRGGKLLGQGLKTASRKRRPTIAAILAALGIMAFHECFDFNLQIPANAFLFTLFFALALRMAGSAEQGAGSSEHSVVGATGWSPVNVQRAGSVDQVAWTVGVEGTVAISKLEIRNSKFSLGSANSQFGIRNSKFLLTPLMVGAVAIVLVVCALRQDAIPYPYNLKGPDSVAEAGEFFVSHPTQAASHLAFLRLMGNKTPLSLQLSEAKVASWIEPNNPYFRDFYAMTLLKLGKRDDGLREITRSIAHSPTLATHFYLNEKFAPRLSNAEQAAIEDGFKEALNLRYAGALDGLAVYYGTLGRFSDQGALYEQAALVENDGSKRASLMRDAAGAYAKAHDGAKAEFVLRKVVADIPTDPRAYQQLTSDVYGPQKDFLKAEELVSEGIQNGVSPISLYLSLAEAAQKADRPDQSKRALALAKDAIEKARNQGGDVYPFYAVLADGARKVGDHVQEVAALTKSLDLRPNSCPVLCRLGNLYLEQQNFDRAAYYFRKATVINPVSADAHYNLAMAEEARYQFAVADNAYARAVDLAPENADYLRRYQSFRERVEQHRKLSSR